MFHPVICRHSGYYMDYCCLISVNINIIDQETTLISVILCIKYISNQSNKYRIFQRVKFLPYWSLSTVNRTYLRQQCRRLWEPLVLLLDQSLSKAFQQAINMKLCGIYPRKGSRTSHLYMLQFAYFLLKLSRYE